MAELGLHDSFLLVQPGKLETEQVFEKKDDEGRRDRENENSSNSHEKVFKSRKYLQKNTP